MVFNILRNADIRNDLSCRHDNNDGWAVVWDENDDFNQYTDVSGVTSRLVWDKRYFFATTSGSCYVSPSTDQTPFEGSTYNTIKVLYRIEPGQSNTVTAPTTGRIQFQTDDDPVYDSDKIVDFPINADNAYNEYIIDMSQKKEWTGNITRVRLYPFIDGAAGYIIHLKSIRVQSPTLFTCDTSFNGTLCNKFAEYAHPCPWVGAGGSCQGEVVSDGISITAGINDKLIIDINEYGEQGIILNPVVGARLKDIARDIEEKLSNIAIGGYAGNKVEAQLGRLRIVADDTREATSTVVVRDTPAARLLGFFTEDGQDVSIKTAGTEAASRYEPAGTVQLSRSELAHLYQPNPTAVEKGVQLDVTRFAVQGGRKDYALTYKDVKLDFTNKTVIDFNNPVTHNGIITHVAYSGDGTANTEFRIFRPKADGSITHIASVDMGLSVSQNDKTFEKDTSVRVRKGDLLGIFDGRLDRGRVEETPNGSYFLYSGDLKNGETVSDVFEVKERGDAGLRLFAHGVEFETEAVINIQFEQPELVEVITAYAEEEVRQEEVNLTRAQVGGIGGGIFITGTTGVDKFGAPAPGLVNLSAVIDKIKHLEPNALDLHPSWLDGVVEPSDKFAQTEIALELDFAKAIPVFFDINRIVLYFRDVSNIKYFSVEYPITTDDADTLRHWGPVSSRYNEVYIEGKLISPDTHPLYDNPIHPTAEGFLDSYQVLDYRVLDLRFEPVRARSLRYNVKNFFLENDVTKATLSNFALAPSPRIMEIEVFANSTPVASISDNFQFESSADGENYVLHTVVRNTGQVSADYLIGYPVQYIRARIKPQGKLNFKSFEVSTSEALTRVRTNSFSGDVSLNVSRNDFASAEMISVTNNSGTTYNYFVDISPQRNLVDRCILWNKLSSDETTYVSEIGPSPSIWRREDYHLREYNYSLNVPAYIADPFWLANRNAVAYISYDHGSTWEARGNLITDYSNDSYLSSVNALIDDFIFVYVVVDLGDVYSLETIETFTPGASFSTPLFSSKDVSDPNELDILNDFDGVKEEVRWLRYRAFSHASETGSTPKLGYVRASLDVLDGRNKTKIPWVPAPKITNFTTKNLDNSPCGEGWHCPQNGFTNWYAIDLEDNYNISNIVIGPTLGNFLVGDFDTIVPGGAGSAYTSSSKSNVNIAYSNSNNSDPKKVNWRSLGEEPTIKERWILVRRQNTIMDECIVHIENNVQENKPSFGSTRWWSSLLSPVYKDRHEFTKPFHSLAVDYAANTGPQLERIELTQSMGIDHVLAKRDQLRIRFYVSDKSQIDFTQGYFAIGRNTNENNEGVAALEGATKDTTNYFKWDLSELEDLISNGWNELFLPFSDNFRVGSPFLERDDLSSLSATSISGRKRIRWLRLEFAGKVNNEAFGVKLDDPKIVRADYTPGKFGNALYLSGSEYAKFPLHNFNTLEGTIEFYLNPEWSKDPGCHSCDDSQDHTIFRFFNIDGFVLGGFMTGYGFRVYLTDGNKTYFLTDNSNQIIVPGDNTHFAVTWDLLSRNSRDVLRTYVNGQLSSAFEESGLVDSSVRPNPNAVLMLGGKAWGGVTERRVSSVDGTLENLRVYNFAKADFSHSINNQGLEYIRPPEELIEISSDGVQFFGSQDRGNGLPILIRNVASGQSFDIHIRHRDTGDSTFNPAQERTTYLEIIRVVAG